MASGAAAPASSSSSSWRCCRDHLYVNGAGKILVAAGGAAFAVAGGVTTLTHGTGASVSGSGFIVNTNQQQYYHGQNGVGNLYSGWQFALPSSGAVPSSYVLQNQTGPFTLNRATVNGPYSRVPNVSPAPATTTLRAPTVGSCRSRRT